MTLSTMIGVTTLRDIRHRGGGRVHATKAAGSGAGSAALQAIQLAYRGGLYPLDQALHLLPRQAPPGADERPGGRGIPDVSRQAEKGCCPHAGPGALGAALSLQGDPPERTALARRH